MLNEVQLGDFILFADAGCTFNTNGGYMLDRWVQRIQDSTEHYDFLSLQMIIPEKKRTTERIFQAFSISRNNTSIRNSGQIVGGIKLIRNGANAREILANIYDSLHADPYIITDNYDAESKRMNLGYFKGNRHDQSISSLALKTMGSVVTRWMAKDQPVIASRLN